MPANSSAASGEQAAPSKQSAGITRLRLMRCSIIHRNGRHVLHYDRVCAHSRDSGERQQHTLSESINACLRIQYVAGKLLGIMLAILMQMAAVIIASSILYQ
nr:hypothetical protein [Bacillus velezensis]